MSYFYPYIHGFNITSVAALSYLQHKICLCILIVMYAVFCILCFRRANWHFSATLTEVFRTFSSVVRQMPGYNSQRRGTVRTLPNYLTVLFYVLCVCKCVLYYCHRVANQLQQKNYISHHYKDVKIKMKQASYRQTRGCEMDFLGCTRTM